MPVNKIKWTPIAALFFIVACSSNADEKHKSDKGTTTNNTKKSTSETSSPSLKELSVVKDRNQLIAQDWQMEEDLPDLKDATDEPGLRLTFRGLYLSNDNSFVKDPRNSIQFGKWNYDDAGKKLTLIYEMGRTESYTVHYNGPGRLGLSGAITNNKEEEYVSDQLQYKNKEDDPFYVDNNRWRTKPRSPETDEAIRSRLKACVHFFVLFYKDAIARNVNPISFYGFPNSLKFYGPGIFIKKKEELDEKWTACFYNEEQAMKAYDIIDKVIEKKYDWPKENIGWLKKNAIVLEMMYKNI